MDREPNSGMMPRQCQYATMGPQNPRKLEDVLADLRSKISLDFTSALRCHGKQWSFASSCIESAALSMIGQAALRLCLPPWDEWPLPSLFSTLPCLPFPRQACLPESWMLPSPATPTPPLLLSSSILLPGLFSRSSITPPFCKNPAGIGWWSQQLVGICICPDFFSFFYLVAEGQGKCKALFHCSLLLWREHVCRSRRLPAEVVVGFSARFACEKYGPVK